MKSVLRSFLINLTALVATSKILPSFVISGGVEGLVTGVIAFMLVTFLLVPLIKVLLLPLNLLTLGIFAWLSNVLALYALVNIVPNFKILPYTFSGANLSGFIIPGMELSPFQVTILASLIIGFIIHFIYWLIK